MDPLMTEIPHVDEDPHGLSAEIVEREGRREAPPTERERVFVGTGFFWGLLVGVLLGAMVIVLAAQNTDATTVRFLGWRVEAPLFLLVLGSVAVGAFLGQVVAAIYRFRRRKVRTEDA